MLLLLLLIYFYYYATATAWNIPHDALPAHIGFQSASWADAVAGAGKEAVFVFKNLTEPLLSTLDNLSRFGDCGLGSPAGG